MVFKIAQTCEMGCICRTGRSRRCWMWGLLTYRQTLYWPTYYFCIFSTVEVLWHQFLLFQVHLTRYYWSSGQSFIRHSLRARVISKYELPLQFQKGIDKEKIRHRSEGKDLLKPWCTSIATLYIVEIKRSKPLVLFLRGSMCASANGQTRKSSANVRYSWFTVAV